MLPATNYRQAQAREWQNNYQQHLVQRLERTLEYLHAHTREKIREHVRSFITLFKEAQRYPELIQPTLEAIGALHPLPLRWGYGSLWEPQLRFALENSQKTALQAQYHNDLADLQLFSGSFEKAIQEASSVLAMPQPPLDELARSVRILFTCQRSQGQAEDATQLFEKMAACFNASLPAASIAPAKAIAWLRFNQNQLELLREQGKTSAALTLVQEMLWLDQQHGSADALLTAELLTHRSTLLWAAGSYPQALTDLQEAIRLYQSEDDLFNSQSLLSNLGLIYWSMGKLDEAETCLQTAIQFYTKSALQQLLSYDLGNLGLVYLARGDLDNALYWTQKHIAHCEKIGFISEQHRGHRNLGVILFYFKEYERVIEETSIAHSYYERFGSRNGYGLDNLYTAMAEYHLGQPESALQITQETLEWSREIGSNILELESMRCLAYISPADARLPLLEASLRMARHMQRPFDEAACLLSLAAHQADENVWQQGLNILMGLGAQMWVVGYSKENPPFLPFLV